MLAEHRRHNRNDDEPLIIGAYSVDQIKEFNARHDAVYGWHPGLGNVYTNVLRLPETYCGSLNELCDRTQT